MIIKKASAGSGKTYDLSHTYINLLLKSNDRFAYRHILAVTFTNKATAEMKGRILKDLSEMAVDNPKAREILTDILHDYSAFAISTIDKFFQQTLKAFSREIGQFADYQIELDIKSLISESMDRILDSLSEDKPELVNWIKSSVADRLENGEKYDIDGALFDIGMVLMSDEHRQMAKQYGIDNLKAYDKKNLGRIRFECRSVIKDFESKAASFGLDIEPGVKIKRPGQKIFKTGPVELTELFEDPFRKYNTAIIINNLLFALGLAGEFYNELDALLKEKNEMCLDESNVILRDIIDGSDAPFVYEKLGVRFDDFLLDEFQDTSGIQWDNFLPLLKESESRGGENLIVGDVKQSIYRFRDSDWELLGHRVKEQFPSAIEVPMDCNWRSLGEIVDFNNKFFDYAARKLDLQQIYSDVSQKVQSKDPQRGFVRVSFSDDQKQAVLESIADARKAGARWSDIAILVRKNNDGSEIASELIRNNIPVISDDSLNLKSSVIVRRLVSLLNCYENPDNQINSFIVSNLNVNFPDNYHSLVDFAECLLRELELNDPETFAGETLFVQAFMDNLRDWVTVNGNNLRLFLKHWDEQKLYIGSPEGSDAIKVLTIHKSKGLEFPYLIFPFAGSIPLYNPDTRWCMYEGNLYPVKLSTSSADTYFSEDYYRERQKQKVDNLNLFYVALTRAEKCLHVISKMPSKACQKGLEKGGYEYTGMAEILYDYCGRNTDRVYGCMYDFSRMERKPASAVMDFPASYPSFALDGRLAPSEDASDFFGPDGATGVDASSRLRGIVLHGILSAVETPDDLEKTVDRYVREGQIPENDAGKYYGLLNERINSHIEWFEAEGRNELSIFSEDGREYRPDRVVMNGDGILVIDYKFGEPQPGYLKQVGNYMRLYRNMGYGNVKGVVWYVCEDKVVEV